MKLILGIIGLAAVAIAIEQRINPPPAPVLIEVPNPEAAPAHDLELAR